MKDGVVLFRFPSFFCVGDMGGRSDFLLMDFSHILGCDIFDVYV